MQVTLIKRTGRSNTPQHMPTRSDIHSWQTWTHSSPHFARVACQLALSLSTRSTSGQGGRGLEEAEALSGTPRSPGCSPFHAPHSDMSLPVLNMIERAPRNLINRSHCAAFRSVPLIPRIVFFRSEHREAESGHICGRPTAPLRPQEDAGSSSTRPSAGCVRQRREGCGERGCRARGFEGSFDFFYLPIDFKAASHSARLGGRRVRRRSATSLVSRWPWLHKRDSGARPPRPSGRPCLEDAESQDAHMLVCFVSGRGSVCGSSGTSQSVLAGMWVGRRSCCTDACPAGRRRPDQAEPWLQFHQLLHGVAPLAPLARPSGT